MSAVYYLLHTNDKMNLKSKFIEIPRISLFTFIAQKRSSQGPQDAIGNSIFLNKY